MKLRYWFAIALAVIVAIIVAGGTVLLETQAGLDWAVGIAERHSDGMITIGAARGRLAGPLTLKNVRITLSGATITAKHLKLDWKPSALASGRLYVVRLRGAHIGIATRPKKEQSSFRLPEKIHLPLHIVIQSANFNDLRVKTTDQRLQFDRVAFALDADDERIVLDRLEARGPRLALGGKLRLEPHGDWPLKARLATILRPPGYPVIEGRTQANGELRGKLRLLQTLRAPFHATLKADIADLFKTPQVRGSLKIAGLDPQAIKPAWPDLKAAADLEFAGNMHRFGAHGTVTLAGERTRSVKLNLKAGLNKKQLRIARLDLALANAPTRLSLHGTIGMNAAHDANLAVAWRNLRWPLVATKPKLRATAGGARLAGKLDAWTLHAMTLLRVGKLAQGRWALAARGDEKTITVNGLAGRWLGGRITGQGRMDLTGNRAFQLALRAHGLHTDTVVEKLRGHLGFALAAGGTLRPLQAHVQIPKLAGRLNGHALTGKIVLDWANNAVNIRGLSLAAGPDRFNAQGRWGKTLALAWRIRAPDLAALGDAFGGHLDAHGKLEGSARAPHITGSLAAGKLHWQDLHIAEARARADIHLGTQAPSSLDVRLNRVARGDAELDTLTATLSGPAEAQRFTLAMKGNRGEVRLAGIGRLADGTWRGKLTEGGLRPAKAPEFTLESPATLTFDTKKMQLGHSCWHDGTDAGFCLAAASDQKGWQADLALDNLPLALADPYLAKDTRLRGRLDGKLTAAGGNGKLNLVADLRTGPGAFSRRIAGESHAFAFTRTTFTAHVNETTATAHIDLTPAAGGTLEATAKIPWRAHAEPAGRLRVVAHIPDLSGIGALTDAVNVATGRLDADFTVSGNLRSPRFAGEARLSHAAFTLTQYGTHVENGSLTLAGAGSSLRIAGRLADGKGGSLDLNGTLVNETEQWALDLHVRGRNFRAVNMPEARVRVSPDLDIGLARRALTINGSVAVPSADIKPPHFAKAIAPTPDLVIVGTKKRQGKPPLAIAADLAIRLGDDVRFNGYGLSARIGGKLTLHEKPGKLTTASGELKIRDGHYEAYGQDLDIKHGRLLFSGGPIANPGLDIRATRRVGLVTAGLQVTGTLRDPKLRVFSNPPMSQSEALAYLLFGHGVQQNNGQENSVYQQAAGAIGIVGGTYAVKSLTKHVGIDTVSVENASRYSTDSNQASLFLGKYLSPRLYVSYGIGLYEPINLLRIRYTLGRHWALEAESGSISGADILFNIEP